MEKGRLEKILGVSHLLVFGVKAAAKMGHAIVRIMFYFKKDFKKIILKIEKKNQLFKCHYLLF